MADKPVRGVPSFDHALLMVVLILLAFGLVMVYSSSLAVAEARTADHSPYYYFVRHGVAIGMGLLLGGMISRVSIKRLKQQAPAIFIVCLILLVAVLVLGREVNGAKRWLSLGFFTMQPSELMKLSVVLFAAGYVVRKAEYLPADRPMKATIVRGFLPLFAVMLVIGLLLLIEPDFGSFFVIAVIGFGILFLGGLDWRIILSLIVMLPLALYAVLRSAPYRLDRFIFLNPWQEPFGKGYQLTQSEMAFGRGGFSGVGLGDGVTKLLYLPEAHTDFILAVIGEELGFIGVLAVILLFLWLLRRAWKIGTEATRLGQAFAALTAYGIGIWLGLQAFINMGSNMTILPPKGITLPFLSYGGSGLVLDCLMIAVLLRVDYENKRLLMGHAI
jgi:cell division protein FtsW